MFNANINAPKPSKSRYYIRWLPWKKNNLRVRYLVQIQDIWALQRKHSKCNA